MAKQLTLNSRKPTHRLFHGDNAFWTPIGAAWPNKDGKGFSLNCEAMPLTGRIVMREALEPKENRARA